MEHSITKEKNEKSLTDQQKDLIKYCESVQKHLDKQISLLTESSQKQINVGLDSLLQKIPDCTSSEEISTLLDKFEETCNTACEDKKTSVIVADIFKCVLACLVIGFITLFGAIGGAGIGGLLAVIHPIAGAIGATAGGFIGGAAALFMAIDLCGDYCMPRTVSFKDDLNTMRNQLNAPENPYREYKHVEPQKTETKEEAVSEKHDVEPDAEPNAVSTSTTTGLN